MCFEGLGSDSRRVFSRFVRGSREISSVSSLYRESTDSLILLDDVACRGWESTILNCPHMTVGQHNCVHGEDITLRCKYIFAVPPIHIHLAGP